MDEPALYNRSLSASEVQAIYNAGSAGKCATVTNPPPPSCAPPPSGIISWWRAEDNANDSVGSNNGTLLGSVTYAPGEIGQAFMFNTTNDGVRIPASASLDV